MIEREQLSSDAFRDAHVHSARALALLQQDDLGNFHAALRAAELNPDIRLVVAIFNTSLGERVRSQQTGWQGPRPALSSYLRQDI